MALLFSGNVLFHRGRKVKKEKMQLMEILENLYVLRDISNSSVDIILYCRGQRGFWGFQEIRETLVLW